MRFMKMLPIVALLAAAPACSHISPFEQQLLDCGSSAVQSQLNGPNGLVSQVMGILNGGQINWQSTLDSLLGTAGPAVVCAVQVAVKQLEGQGGSTASAATVATVHGNSWLVSEGHYKLVK